MTYNLHTEKYVNPGGLIDNKSFSWGPSVEQAEELDQLHSENIRLKASIRRYKKLIAELEGGKNPLPPVRHRNVARSMDFT